MKRTRLAILLALSLSAPLHAADDLFQPDMPNVNLPDLGDPASSALSTTQESLLGVKLARELRGSEPVVEDPELGNWLNTLGQRLVRSAHGSGKFTFFIVKDREVNAYSMPGGVVAVNSGLILATRSESELAAVLAHEIAHVTQRHIARMMANTPSPLITGLGVLAGAAAATKSADAGQAIITGTIAAQAHKQLAFSREAEFEADRIGLQILASAGFDPGAMPSFLEKLDRRTTDKDADVTKYLRTHPLGVDRISDARTRANQLGHGNHQDSPDYLYAREKLRALTQPSSPAITGQDPALAQYAQAIRQLQIGNFQAVIQALGSQSNQPASALAIATALNGLHRYPESIKLLQPLANQHPDQAGLTAPLAEALLATDQAPQAWQLLNRNRLEEQTSIELLEIRQRVAQQAGLPAEAYQAAAERDLRMGEYKHARAVLEQASRLPSTSAQTAARLHALALEISRLETQNKRLDKL